VHEEEKMKLLDELSKASLKTDIPDFRIGDTVEVSVKIIEGDKEKTHDFKGVVIARKGRGISETFIVRKLSFGEGVERIFYLNSPMIKSISVLKKGRVRKAKLYYLRGKIGKKAKVREMELVPDTSPKIAPTEEKAEAKTE
jgi:large subunit ribosomal protein L19